MKAQIRSLIVILIVCSLSFWFSQAGSDNGLVWRELPIFKWVVILAFTIQWLAFVPAYIMQTERFYDATGSLTYITVVAFVVWSAQALDPRALLLAGVVSIWAIRLGSFLLKRIIQDGSDSRFDDIKPVFFRFLLTWSLQGLWVIVTAGAALAAISSSSPVALDEFALFGAIIWGMGFVIEVIADRQKRVHRAEGKGDTFIRSGLWAYSRHPNYFGEILLWIGVSVIAYPVLQGWQLVTLISPLFVWLLLTKVSGIPLLEAKSDKRWGDLPEYQQYKQNTPVLIPRFK